MLRLALLSAEFFCLSVFEGAVEAGGKEAYKLISESGAAEIRSAGFGKSAGITGE